MVGAGGIGCELLKDLILLGYGEIHVVDLDTIDLSNLNRQFLFRHKDIKKPKASTAVNAVQQFNFFNTKLVPYQASIFQTDLFPLSWFRQFDLIINGLDNIQARAYINKIGLFLNKKIVETGTQGTQGQVSVTFPYKTECYDCVPKVTPKTFPVCTIRSTPSQPVHCVHWAKNFLFNSLFGEDGDLEEETSLEGKSTEELGAENQEEIENLIKENNELKNLKSLLVKNEDSFIDEFIKKIFIADIEKLLKLTNLWKLRAPPTPLKYDHETKEKVSKIENLGTGQKVWTIEENLKALRDSTKSLQARMQTEKTIDFDKDDEDTLNFVVATTNIRSFIFGIPVKSKFEIKSIAGNIIPAIATTNAIVAGFASLTSLKLINDSVPEETQILNSSAMFISGSSDRFLMKASLIEPRPSCPACSITRGVLNIDLSTTFGELIDKLVEKYGYSDEIAISVGSKLIYDIDFDDNKDKTLRELNVVYGDHLNITDESDAKNTVEFYVEVNDNGEVQLPDLEIPAKPKPVQDEDDDDGEADGINEVADVQEIEDDELIILDETSPEKHRIEVSEDKTTKKPKTI